MSVFRFTLQTAALAAILCAATVHSGRAQNAPRSAAAKHPTVCARGVRIYTDKSQVPTPHDTLTLPPADAPIRVTSPEEAEAAEMALRGRAGSVGATGVLVVDEESDDGAGKTVRRRATALYARADSARAQQACK